MPTRFDHAVIAVSDLNTATQLFQHLGFDAQPGGRHTGRGTHNALVRFGLDYFELLSVYNETEARAYSAGSPILLDALHGQEAGLVSYALATTTIDEDSTRFRGTGTQLPQPDLMARKRPDGQVLSWRTLAPGENSWHKPWPFLIQWDTPDAQRLQIDLPGSHPNGAIAWSRIAIATYNLESTLDVYQNQLGLKLIYTETDYRQNAHHAILSLGKSSIDLYAPAGPGTIQQVLADNAEGPFLLSFSVKSLEDTRAYFTQNQIKFSKAANALNLSPEEALGIRIRFTQ